LAWARVEPAPFVHFGLRETTSWIAIATLLKKTWDIREASYIKGTYTYKSNWWEAASQATSDPELIPLLAAMLSSGFADFPEWADKILGTPS
jgi:hypothetical protein